LKELEHATLKANKAEKGIILDELTAAAGYEKARRRAYEAYPKVQIFKKMV
jgi:hypothetical protein